MRYNVKQALATLGLVVGALPSLYLAALLLLFRESLFFGNAFGPLVVAARVALILGMFMAQIVAFRRKLYFVSAALGAMPYVAIMALSSLDR